MSNKEPEPLYFFPRKADNEQYDFMIEKSETARKCRDAWIDENKLQHAAYLIDLVKIGYTREELYAFLRIVYTIDPSGEGDLG